MALALAAVSRVRQTAIRLGRILDGRRTVDTRVSKPALAVVSAVSLAGLMILPHAPELVVFQDTHASAQVAHVPYAAVNTPVAYRPSAGAHVIPAVLHENVVPATMPSSHSVHRRFSARAKTKTIQTNGRTMQASPMVVRTSAVDHQQVRPTLVFVVETDEFGADGVMVSNVRVWTLTVIRQQGPIASQKGNAWKAI
jgi:hypothetical protein